jgi:hypothetical protein
MLNSSQSAPVLKAKIRAAIEKYRISWYTKYTEQLRKDAMGSTPKDKIVVTDLELEFFFCLIYPHFTGRKYDEDTLRTFGKKLQSIENMYLFVQKVMNAKGKELEKHKKHIDAFVETLNEYDLDYKI